jgi:hypothetical protein
VILALEFGLFSILGFIRRIEGIKGPNSTTGTDDDQAYKTLFDRQPIDLTSKIAGFDESINLLFNEWCFSGLVILGAGTLFIGLAS